MTPTRPILTIPSGSLTNFFRYTGREFDTETNLYYYRARYYDPTTGRFFSEDPFRSTSIVDFRRSVANLGASLRATREGSYLGPLYDSFLSNPVASHRGARNFYRFVANDPVNGRDPFGLWTISVGLSLSAQLGAFNFQVNLGVAIDSCGNVGTYTSEGGGVGAGGQFAAGGSVAVSPGGTCICDLQGPFEYTNIGLGDGAGASLDQEGGYGSHGQLVSVWGFTGGAHFGGGSSEGINTTQVHPLGGGSCSGCQN